MTITTTVNISHEEMRSLHLSDAAFKNMGYHLSEASAYGRVYSKTSWNATCKAEKSLSDKVLPKG